MARDSTRPPAPWTVLWKTATTDRWVQLTALIFVVFVPLYLLPILSIAQRAFVSRALGPFLFLGLVVTALSVGLGPLRTEERRFWQDVIAAFVSLLVVAALYLFVPQVEKPLALGLVIEALYVAYYVTLILAAERRPDRTHRWRPMDLERLLAWPAVTTFIVGLFGYFFVIPSLIGAPDSDQWNPSYVLYLTLDAYLTIRFVALSWTARSVRWRTSYLVLALTTGAVFLNDLLELLVYSSAPMKWGAALDLAYYAPYLIVVLARCRHLPLPVDAAGSAEAEQPEMQFTRPSRRTMVHALAIPLLHFGCYSLGLFSGVHRPARESLVFWTVLVLGSIALIQQWLLEKRARELWRDRQRAETSVRHHEKDLRVMVERYHSDQKLRLSEEKFAKVFRVSPDAMAISSLPDGRFKEINDSFEIITGYFREDILGRTVSELGLWADPAQRTRMLRALERDGAVRDMETRFRLRSGRIITGSMSAETLRIDGEPHLLSVTRDITERKRIEDKLKAQAVLLDKAQDAIAVLDLEDRVTYWNRSAERLYGWSAAEALGRRADELLWGDDATRGIEVSASAAENGDWTGELEQVTKGGDEIVVESWWTLVRDDEGKATSKLIISSDVTGKPRPEIVPS
ncbi:MAG: PAS domain S-box protein [bacterium]|nr:PAS domain S-box protein [bacterium]